MIIQLESFKGKKEIVIDISEIITIDDDYNAYDNIAKTMISGKIVKDGNIYDLDLDIKAEINFKCDKCLEPVRDSINFKVTERFSNEIISDDEENEIWAINNNEISILEHIKSALAMNMPMKVLCSEGCKGLCMKCGKNFNEGNCSCDNENYDPRFEVLRSLFTDKEV